MTPESRSARRTAWRTIGWVLLAVAATYLVIALFFADTMLGYRLGLRECPPGSVEVVRGDNAESYCVPLEIQPLP